MRNAVLALLAMLSVASCVPPNNDGGRGWGYHHRYYHHHHGWYASNVYEGDPPADTLIPAGDPEVGPLAPVAAATPLLPSASAVPQAIDAETP